MGKLFSKNPSKNTKSDFTKMPSSAANVPDREQYEIYDPNKYDLEAVEALRKEFKEDPEMCISNLLLMSFMFFDDYQEEIRRLVHISSKKGRRLNTQLIQDHQKQVLMPDSVFESVNGKVKFRLTRGPKKGLMEPLATQRMFILHDTIEIEDKRVSVDYSRIDKPSYRAEVEESRNNKGFVKVHVLGTSARHSESENWPTPSDSATSSLKRRKSAPNINGQEDISYVSPSAIGNDSGFNTAGNSDSSSDYFRITAARTPRKIYIHAKDVYTSISQLPSKCITPIKVRNDLSDSETDDDDDEEEESYNNRIRKTNPHQLDLYRTCYYLNSSEFMSHFKNNIFPNHLGEVMGFHNDSIHQATSIPGAIYCEGLDETNNIVHWEVIPTIPMPWPEIAFEWTLRRRRTVWDRREKEPIAYKWPTPKMVEDASKLNCVVIPRGFMPKKNDNSNMHIEWEVAFPKAERYLEFRMSHAQMRIFLYLITIHKKFIEPLTRNHGLTIDHLRILMLWECEANYKAWPEDKLGIKLKSVLKSLYDYMGKAELPHYFIRTKNVFENVPRKYLIPAQDIIHRILEIPLPYLLSTLKHLKYMPGKFYPQPDLEELYQILTGDNVLQNEAVLDIRAFENAKKEEEIKQRYTMKNKLDKEQKWNRRYLEQQKNANKRKLLKDDTNNKKNLKQERKESFESIDLNFSMEECFTNNVVGTFRKIRVLTFFIQHFLQIAKRSFKLSTTNQTLLYLKQAWCLTMILLEVDYEEARKFQTQIREEEEHCLRKQVSEPKVPSTPKRNSTIFGNEILQVKGKDINIKNLSRSFDANTMVTEPKPSTSGVNKKRKIKYQEKKGSPKENVKSSPHSDNEGIRMRQYTPTPAKEIRKSVSFRNEDRNIISEADDNISETTSL